MRKINSIKVDKKYITRQFTEMWSQMNDVYEKIVKATGNANTKFTQEIGKYLKVIIPGIGKMASNRSPLL